MNAEQLQNARNLLEQSLVWDNHTCMPLRPGDHTFLDQLQRAKNVGVNVIALNPGFGPQSLEAHLRMAASFRQWLAQHSDQYLLAHNIQDIETARSDGKLAVIFDVEGMVQLVGSEHVGIALDYVFDSQELINYVANMHGTFGENQGMEFSCRFAPHETLVPLVARLFDLGYAQKDLQNILGANWYRVAMQVWK